MNNSSIKFASLTSSYETQIELKETLNCLIGERKYQKMSILFMSVAKKNEENFVHIVGVELFELEGLTAGTGVDAGAEFPCALTC